MGTVKTSSGAVWSLVLGILSLACLGPIAGIPAVICGHLSMGNIRRSNGDLGGEGIALAGLITGYLGVVVWIFMIIALAVFGVMGDRIRSQLQQTSVEMNEDSYPAASNSSSEQASIDWLKNIEKPPSQ